MRFASSGNRFASHSQAKVTNHLPVRTAPQTNRLGRSAQLAMQLDLDAADLAQVQLIANKIDAIPVLRVGHRIIAPVSLEAWIARLFTRLDTSKERFVGQIDADIDVLQHLRVNRLERRMFLLPCWNHRHCIVVAQRNTLLLVAILTRLKDFVVQPATFLKLLVQQCLLGAGWVDTVLVGSHSERIAQVFVLCNRQIYRYRVLHTFLVMCVVRAKAHAAITANNLSPFFLW